MDYFITVLLACCSSFHNRRQLLVNNPTLLAGELPVDMPEYGSNASHRNVFNLLVRRHGAPVIVGNNLPFGAAGKLLVTGFEKCYTSSKDWLALAGELLDTPSPLGVISVRGWQLTGDECLNWRTRALSWQTRDAGVPQGCALAPLVLVHVR